MRAAAVPLLFALVGALASGSALAFKGGGGKGSGGGGGGVKGSGGGFNGHSGGFKSSGGLNKSRGHVQHHGGHHRHHHHGHHHHNGVAFVGVGFASPWPWYYPPAYYPHYQPVVYETQPTTYIEQGGTPAATAEPSGWWYYCDASRAYYPYVKECASAWQRVPALPPPPQ